MCGINGFVAEKLPTAATDIVEAMTCSLARRGPDAEGTHRWPKAVLGHRRLSIYDLSELGKQPMLAADGKVGIVFNGAIYNFLDIRAELEGLGHRFRSQCDTEVLLAGYLQWGVDALLPRLRGMFAFALWDQRIEKLWLVRDRLGVKPLLYSFRNGQLAFASTVEALRAAGLAGEIDDLAVLQFLEFGYVRDDRTIFQGVHKVPASTVVEWHKGELKQRRYWSLPQADESSKITFQEAVEETERLLVESVKLRLDADVPVGALLSGGIDSTLICWAVSKLNRNLKAFTVGTLGDPKDETAQAVATAKMLGIQHEVMDFPSNTPSLFDDLINAYGEPFGCTSALGMLEISKMIKPHATVLLTGDGGDDVFLGYPMHHSFWVAQKVARTLPSVAAKGLQVLKPMMGIHPALMRARNLLDYVNEGIAAVHKVNDGLPYYRRLGVLGRRFASMELPQRQMKGSAEDARHLMRDFLNYFQDGKFVGEFLTKVDAGAMYHALEARSPLLDHKLWEFASKLPYDVRLKNGELKSILREIVRRRVCPDVAARKKQGFVIPAENWLLTRWRGRVEEMCQDSLLEREGWIAKGGLQRMVADASKRTDAPHQLWFCTVLEHWMRALGSRSTRALAMERA